MATFAPNKYSHLCERLIGPQASKKNPNETTRNRSRDIQASSAVPQPTAPSRAPISRSNFANIYVGWGGIYRLLGTATAYIISWKGKNRNLKLSWKVVRNWSIIKRCSPAFITIRSGELWLIRDFKIVCHQFKNWQINSSRPMLPALHWYNEM
jgi:hypothetical protein